MLNFSPEVVRPPARKPFFRLLALLALALGAFSALAFPAALARSEPAPAHTEAQAQPVWPFAASDIAPDPAFRFGVLENGMRYVIRQNTTPVGTGIVRMEVNSGSLAERDDELGYAHFVEHMAFNGSARVPEGEMIKLLEREGLAFGADTNASTSYDWTQYKLDLPRNDPALLDTALMLMRETASALTFSPAAVERERGVILSEMRDRDTYRLRDYVDEKRFFHEGAHYVDRLPIGILETLTAATADSLRAFWAREYVPANTTLVVIGDFDPAMVEEAITRHFASWQAAPLPARPDPGPVQAERGDETAIYIDPALSERVVAARHGPWLHETDSIATRQRNILRQVGYGIINRRLQRLARSDDPPFRDAGFGTGDVFKAGRSTRLIVDAGDGDSLRGLRAAAATYRQAMAQGFSSAEVGEQIANLRNQLENAAASTDTRSHQALFNAVESLLRYDIVPSHPQASLERFMAFLPDITPDRVLEALAAEAVPLENPLLRFKGRQPPSGNKQALRDAWNAAMAAPLDDPDELAQGTFAYSDFGPPGVLVSDMREERLGIRLVRFANGLRLNLKPTELERDRVRVALHLDGGQLLNTPDNPLATAMVSMLPTGGLGRHSQDELQSLLAGRTVDLTIDDAADRFEMVARTTRRDLELQLGLMAAALTDPGYRPIGETRYRRNIANFFASKDATPASALGWALGEILSDGDPRYTLQPQAAYHALSFARLRADMGDRLEHGAIELSLVGDFDEDEAIQLVARTLGALPAREEDFRAYAETRVRPFTTDRSARIVRHKGLPDQALLRMIWPTTDDSDPAEVLRLGLLAQVMRIELLDSLREVLGKAYSPGASSSPSRVHPGYGTFQISASIDLADVDETRAAVLDVIARLRAAPVEQDILQRARQPMLEAYDNALKGNGGWMNLVKHAQSQPDRIVRFLAAKERLAAITAEDVHATALRYLAPDAGIEVLALHENAQPAP